MSATPPPEPPPSIERPGLVGGALARLRHVAMDLTPLRVSREFRLLWSGQFVSDLGSHITMVAAPFQIFQLTHSTLAVGLLGLCWLVPLLTLSVFGGSIADAVDRRKLMLVSNLALPTLSAVLALNAILAHPHLWVLYVVSTLSAAAYALSSPAFRSLPARLLPKELLPSAFALETAGHSFGSLVGPAVAGVLIAAIGLPSTYLIDLATYLVAAAAVAAMAPVPPAKEAERAGLASMLEGLRFLKGRRVLQTTFTIDLNAMIFGMPQALFPAFALRVLHGGPALVGFLYAAPAGGALVASLLSGRARHVRRQGLACMVAVVVWGAAIAGFGLSRITWLALAMLAVAGAADLVSGIYRTTILQTVAPDAMRGRLSGIELAVVASGPSIGDIEGGAVGALVSVPFAVVSGGILCVAGVGVLALLVPQFARYDAREPTP
ncbi:MAG: MFS transporter [Actinomycetota bacterium]